MAALEPNAYGELKKRREIPLDVGERLEELSEKQDKHVALHNEIMGLKAIKHQLINLAERINGEQSNHDAQKEPLNTPTLLHLLNTGPKEIVCIKEDISNLIYQIEQALFN